VFNAVAISFSNFCSYGPLLKQPQNAVCV